MGTCKHNWHSHKYLDNRIRQKHNGLEAKGVENRLTSRNN